MKQRPDTHRAALGVHLSFLSPELVEFCGLLGFEWLFLDAEHTPLNPHLCCDLVRAADVVGMVCMVRVPEIQASMIDGYLDVGVRGIMATNVSSAAEARELVAAVKFAPEGVRGATSRCRAAHYGLLESPSAYFHQANEATWTAALIESGEGIDRLDEIASVRGLDYVAIGPGDLGLSLGIRGGLADPKVRATVEEALARLRILGTPQLRVVSDADEARSAEAAGARLIAVPDSVLLAGAGKAYLQRARTA